jgi:hypothetical protein
MDEILEQSAQKCNVWTVPLTEYFLSGQFEQDKTAKTKICNTYHQLLMGERLARVIFNTG